MKPARVNYVHHLIFNVHIPTEITKMLHNGHTDALLSLVNKSDGRFSSSLEYTSDG